MKRILYLLAVSIGLLSSCTDDSALNNHSGKDAGGPVTLDFCVRIPDIQSLQTRGPLLDETANAELGELLPYIFIYEDTGNSESNYLRTLVYGSSINNSGQTIDDPDPSHSSDGVAPKFKYFSATVDGTAEDAIIHLVLIHEKEKDIFEYQLAEMTNRSELGMFTGAYGLLTTSAAYWSRIVLGMPINSKNKEAVKNKLSHINMVRNFSQVTVESEAENFVVTGFVIVNGMDCGYVAAYNENIAGRDNFVEFNGKNYDDLTKTMNYIPIRHPYALRDHADNQLDEWLDVNTNEFKDGSTWDTAPKYMFERPIQETRMTCVLVRGLYTPKGIAEWKEGFYKLDIGAYDKNEEHRSGAYIGYGVYEMYHLIRNISYDIRITDAASAGHSTAESAIVGPPANNLTASVQTRNVLTIGDGVDEIGVTIYTGNTFEDKVDGTTVIIVDSEVKDSEGNIIGYEPYPKQARLTWFYKDGEQDPEQYLDEINHLHTGYELKEGPDGIIQTITGIDNAGKWSQQSTPNWYGCDLVFNTPTDVPQREVVRLYKEFGLSRDITFVLRKRWEFVTDDVYKSNIEVYPGSYSFDTNTMPSEKLNEVRRLIPGPGDVGSSRGAQLTVMFELPSDIPQELFPLEFKIGFDRQNVENAYTGNAVVVYGESLFSDDEAHFAPDVPRMQFVKTVTWDYYNGSGDFNDNGHKIVTARFQTTTDVLDNNAVDEESVTRVRVYNPYFILGEDSFTREANPTDPDPHQTMWLWYFGDPGWQKYFSENQGNGADTYNELWFNNHKVGTQYGPYIGMTYGRNAANPDFSFNVNSTAPEGGYNAKLTITATSETYRSGNNYYRRLSYARVIYNDGSYVDRNLGEITKRDPSNKGMPSEVTWEFTLEEGKTISSIVIWTEKVNNSDREDGNTWALYYSIRFALTQPL